MISTGSLFLRYSTRKGAKHTTINDYLFKRTKVTFCVGLLGGLAESSIIAREGNTVVHAVITTERLQSINDSFSTLPLTIDYRDRSYAHGRVPMTPTRRDKSNTDDEILAARVIDRSIRPLFPKGLMTESIQVIVTCHALDNHHDPISLGINAASAALMLSSIPWNGVVAGPYPSGWKVLEAMRRN